jgi:hypothetical protein
MFRRLTAENLTQDEFPAVKTASGTLGYGDGNRRRGWRAEYKARRCSMSDAANPETAAMSALDLSCRR